MHWGKEKEEEKNEKNRNKLKSASIRNHTLETIQMMEDRRKHNNKTGEKECEMHRIALIQTHT